MLKSIRRVQKTLAAGVVAAAMGLGATSAAAEEPIEIGWTAWSDAEFVTRMAKQLLEERMGYDVKLTMADIGVQYQGIANGDLDVMLMSWLPVTHQSYWEKFAGDVVNLGPLYTDAKLGWAVPSYVPEDQVSSIEDLKKADIAEKFGSKVQGIDPGAGLMQASEKAMEEYDLGKVDLVSASGAAMTAAYGRAVRRDEWIVVTSWSPHWMHAKWDTRYLEDPKGSLGKKERIHALAREGFYQDYPTEVVNFLTRMYIPLDQLQNAMLDASEDSYEEAVSNYIEDHPKRVKYWVTGEFQ
ncbi:MAG TPA: glycine betaine ABC transporter substrate-binding protein [Gammaproteobacteria bacterium]|nr:glycine betaine ABC transporter substrate-binding protein [Gammaproteobacteria bacterium]